MHKLRYSLIIIFIITIALITACTSNNNNSENTQEDVQSPSTNTTEPTLNNDGNENQESDPFGKYDSTVTVTLPMVDDQTIQYRQGEDRENNVWFDAYLEQLNIDINVPWSADSGLYLERSNTIIASGDLPDIMKVNAVQLQKLAQAGMIEDLTNVYEQYATDGVRAVTEAEGGLAFETAKVNGQLMAIPAVNGSVATMNMLHIRKDWLDELSLPVPESMQDVLNVMDAFTHKDPDQDGQNNTYGLAISQNLFGGFAEIYSFANSYHAYPRTWIKDSDGSLVYGSVQPVMKDVLAKLNELYEDGQLKQEFPAMANQQVNEDVASGKVGMFYGKQWNPVTPMIEAVKLNSDAEWISIPLQSIDEEPAKPQTKVNVAAYYVVRKGFEHPEALLKMMNLYVKLFKEQTDVYGVVHETDANGEPMNIEIFKYSPVQLMDTNKNVVAHLKIVEALSGKEVEMNLEEQITYDQVKEYVDTGDVSLWAAYKIYGPNGTQSILHYYETNEIFQFNEFYGAATPTMTSYSQTLDTMEEEVFTKIIMGESDISEFDKFVKDWQDLGGTDITAEVNEWYQSK